MRYKYMKVYLVEHRMSVPDFETVVMHVASSMLLAKQWCRNNQDAEKKDITRPWWWVITAEEVDGFPLKDIELTVVDWNGNPTKDNNRPTYDEKGMPIYE